MAWLASTTGIETDKKVYIQRIFYVSSGYVCKRTATRTTKEYRGLTSAGADSQVTTSAGTAGCLNANKVRVDDSGQYKVVEEIETYGAWAYDETYSEVGP